MIYSYENIAERCQKSKECVSTRFSQHKAYLIDHSFLMHAKQGRKTVKKRYFSKAGADLLVQLVLKDKNAGI